jgi:hypothetical protein
MSTLLCGYCYINCHERLYLWIVPCAARFWSELIDLYPAGQIPKEFFIVNIADGGKNSLKKKKALLSRI